MNSDFRIAWLFPSLAFGNYWHPVLAEFAKCYPSTIVYTGDWRGYSPGFENAFSVKTVGKMQFVDAVKSETGYSKGFIKVSPAIITELLKFKPKLIFTSGFCLWTLLALLMKAIANWRVVIVYDGSSPGIDYRDSKIRTGLRRIMTRFTDGFITNSLAGKQYLRQYLSVPEEDIFARPYQVPDATALLKQGNSSLSKLEKCQQPIFLFTGQIILRKGLQYLLEACKQLKQQGYQNYTLLIAGDGEQRQVLQKYCETHQLNDCVHWLGWVDYAQLGAYFHSADVFILPTLEDSWGMVVLEAMAFGKPILCSKWAGASELIQESENGYLFDPYYPEQIVAVMKRLITQPDSTSAMGKKSIEIIAQHTPRSAAQFLTQVTNQMLEVA